MHILHVCLIIVIKYLRSTAGGERRQVCSPWPMWLLHCSLHTIMILSRKQE